MLLDLHENMLEWEKQRSTQLTETYIRQKNEYCNKYTKRTVMSKEIDC